MNVIKKNGEQQPFDLNKIKNMINFSCKDLDVNSIVLESNLHISIKNNMKTSELQELLILESIKLISEEEPDWVYVAGRLATKALHSDIFKTTKIDYNEYDRFLDFAINNNYYRKDFITKFTKNEIKNLSKLIDPSLDFKMSIAQILSLKDKYLLKHQRGHIEYPQFSDLTSSMILASIENDHVKWSKEFFKVIRDEECSLATPFKSNLRLANGNVGSCFIISGGDSLAQIVKVWQDISKISKEGGGVGWYCGYLRPGSSYSKKVVKANKINKWTKIVNDIAIAVNQRGIRPGAVTPALDWWHLDIEDFIEMKSETKGDLREKCFDLFPQVIGDQYFFEKVISDEDVYLFNQYELKEKFNIDVIPMIGEDLYNAHLKIKELADSGKFKAVRKISAKALWKEFLRIWFETGDFYMVSKDNINKSNYLNKFAISNSVNLCCESWSLNKTPENWESTGNKDDIRTTKSDGMYHSCNLSSINLANIHNDKQLKRVVETSMRMLDNSIDVGSMPVFEAEQSSFMQRNVGLGTVGTADWMAMNKLTYTKEEDLIKIEALYEKIAYYAYTYSIELAKEKGAYPLFEKADYSKLFGREIEDLMADSIRNGNNFDWKQVQQDIMKYGIRNSLLLAIAPNTSSALVQNAVASYLPPHSLFNVQTLAKITVPVIPKYLKQRRWYYRTKFQMNPTVIINLTKRIQKWVDTGISMEVPINIEISNMKEISDCILDGFINGTLKAVYYSVSIDGKKIACTSCAG